MLIVCEIGGSGVEETIPYTKQVASHFGGTRRVKGQAKESLVLREAKHS